MAGLWDDLRGGFCSVFGGSVLVRIGDHDGFVPDGLIVCGPLDLRARYTTEPVVVVEILSPGTETRDRGYKWLHYQAIPPLQHYLLVARHMRRVEVFSRREGSSWAAMSMRTIRAHGST